MIALRCANCGAPLEVDDHESLVECKYCHATTRVRERTLQMAAPVGQQWVPPPAYTPPPPPAPWPSPHGVAPIARPRRTAVPVIMAVLGVAMMGGMTFAVANLQGNGGGVLGALQQMTPAPVMNACLVDANGDAVLDLATLRYGGDTQFPEIFDGVTGTSRWRGESVPTGTKLLCVGHHFVLGLFDFSTRIHDARAPAAPLIVRGADVTKAVRPGPGCLDLEATDGSHLAVAVDGSNATACPPSGLTVNADGAAVGVMGLSSDEVNLEGGDEVLRLRARETGTEVLSFRPNARVPERPLGLQKCSFSAALAANPTTAFIQGCPIGSDKAGLVVALRRSDLTELWRTPIGSGSEWDVDLFVWNGRALLVTASTTIYALDGATGATLWRIN